MSSPILNINAEDIPYLEHFGMTRAAILRVIQNHICIVDEQIYHALINSDIYKHPTQYNIDSIPKEQLSYRYSVKEIATEIVMQLITNNTNHAGHTSATALCDDIGINPDEPLCELDGTELNINWDEISTE